MFLELINCYPDRYETNPDAQLALSNLMRASGKRKNIVCADAQVLQAIIDSHLYAEIDKTYALDIIDTRRELVNVRSYLSVYTVVDFDFSGVIVEKVNGINIFRVGFKFFSESAESVSLLTEGNLDSDFYLKIAHYYTNSEKIPFLRFKFNSSPGGGNQTKPTFQRRFGEQGFLLCVVDSDKKHPNGDEGSTSSSFTQEDRNMNNGNLVKVIPVHEAECLLPTKLIETVVANKIREKVDLYDELVEFIGKDSRVAEFFDFKNGLTLKNAIGLDLKYGDFWLEVLKTKPKFSGKPCVSSKECTDCGSCPAIDGFGDTLLRHAVDHMDRTNLKPPRFNLDEYLQPHWSELGKLLVSWGCIVSGGSARVS